ncbi:hypothetical protein BV20DRAFT_1054383 [Pilatotrama ljubarskyi]|nr:hypothetical protein BV20DRAFT_1054383 [Pilatotrama ljubarskyi]
MDTRICGRCKKLESTSEAERHQHQREPQCEGCGCVYPFLKHPLCGSCKERELTLHNGMPSSATSATRQASGTTELQRLKDRAREFEQLASQHRLTQGPKSDAVSQKALNYKEKKAALKEQRGYDFITFQLTAHYALSAGSPPRKLHNVCTTCRPKASTPTDEALSDMLDQLHKVFKELPSEARADVPLIDADWIRSNTSWIICKGGNGGARHALGNRDVINNETVVQTFERVKRLNLLSDNDIAQKQIRLQVTVYCSTRNDDNSSDDDIVYLDVLPEKPKKSARSVTSRIKSKKSRLAGAEGLRSSATTRAVSSTTPKLTSQYCASFRPPSAIPIQYCEFRFRRVTCFTDDTAQISLVNTCDEAILIAKDWQKYKGMEKREGGYLGSGASKYAFMGMYQGKPYAVLQGNSIGSYRFTESENRDMLYGELKLLALGQFFVDSFYRRAREYGIESRLARIRFNHAGAFIGEISESNLPSHEASGSEDTIESQGYKEHKFSGTFEIGDNDDSVLGQTVDAFAHHVLVDSDHTCVFVDLQGFVKNNEAIFIDPQAHTVGWPGDIQTGPWDGGENGINTFISQHRCNAFCRELGLVSEGKKAARAGTRRKAPIASTLNAGIKDAVPDPKRRRLEVKDIIHID